MSLGHGAFCLVDARMPGWVVWLICVFPNLKLADPEAHHLLLSRVAKLRLASEYNGLLGQTMATLFTSLSCLSSLLSHLPPVQCSVRTERHIHRRWVSLVVGMRFWPTWDWHFNKQICEIFLSRKKHHSTTSRHLKFLGRYEWRVPRWSLKGSGARCFWSLKHNSSSHLCSHLQQYRGSWDVGHQHQDGALVSLPCHCSFPGCVFEAEGWHHMWTSAAWHLGWCQEMGGYWHCKDYDKGLFHSDNTELDEEPKLHTHFCENCMQRWPSS